MFYPDQKEGMSPSSLDQWLRQKSAFVRTYFEGEKGPETASMAAGTRVHRLIEAGLVPAKNVYQNAEMELRQEVKPGIYFRGKPDSWEGDESEARFVDYKTGKANAWKEKLPTDIKMKATAWLVWMQTGKPAKVKGSIEFIAMTWDPVAKEVVPIEDTETEIIPIEYTAAELESFTQVIGKAIDDVNAFYEKWKESSADFVNHSDLEIYEDLNRKIEELEAQKKDVGERILGQMQFGGQSTLKTPLGTFYLTERHTYEYPDHLAFEVDGKEYTLEDADQVEAGAKAAKKNYELLAEPTKTTVSMGFRKPKEK